MQPLFRVLRSASALWPYYLGIVVISSVTAGLALVSPFILREATNTIVEAFREGPDAATSAMTTIVFLAIALFAAQSLDTLMRNIGGYLGDVSTLR